MALLTGALAPEEWLAARTSVIVAARAVVFALPAAVATAFFLSRGRVRGRIVLEALVQAPLVLSPVVMGLLLLLVFGRQGPAGAVLLRLFKVRLVFTSEGASLAAGVGAFPLMVRSVRLGLDGVDRRLEAAAESLGAGFFDRLASVTLPLAGPGILSAAVVGFAACIGEFGAVITFAGNLPGVTQTLPLAVYSDLQAPGGDDQALRLAGLSLMIAALAVAAGEALARAGGRTIS